MFYKHWKKIALALTGFFWVSCDDSVSSEECLYGTPTNYDIMLNTASIDYDTCAQILIDLANM